MVCLGGSIAVHVSLPEGVRGSEYKSGALIVEVIDAGVALGISVGAALNSHFLCLGHRVVYHQLLLLLGDIFNYFVILTYVGITGG